MSDKARGVYNKFIVIRKDGKSDLGQKHENCGYFVLDLGHDPYAIPALFAYASACRALYPLLSDDVATLASELAARPEFTARDHGSPKPKLTRVQAKLIGFEGDPCPDCGQFMLVRNGTCLKCDGCGATTGCS